MLINLLREALEARYLFQFDYDDKPRLVEPHALGLNAKGDVVLRGYQVAGESNTKDEGWKLFTLEKARMIVVRDDVPSMAPRPGYKAADSAMAEIFAALPQPVEVQVAA